MTIEQTPRNSDPEASKSSFEVEFKNADVAYILLSQGTKSQQIKIKNNWSEISDPGYDVFEDIFTEESSPLTILQKPDLRGRDSRNLEIRQIIHSFRKEFDVFYWESNVEKIQEELAAQGLSCFVSSARSDEESSFVSNRCIVINKKEYSLVLRFVKPDSEGFINGGIGIDLGEKIDKEGQTVYDLKLTDYTNFMIANSFFMEGTRKTIKALYKIADKELPSAKLTFWPRKDEKEENKFVAMVCGVCKSGYPIDQISLSDGGILFGNPKCPNCGATDPHFLNVPLISDSEC